MMIVPPSNVKTKLCNNWETSGQCPYGQKCHFAHGSQELQAPPQGAQHPKYKTALCEMWKQGSCTRDVCNFAHGEGELKQTTTKFAKKPEQGKYKVTLCRSWMKNGRCDMGERCTFAHGEAELRGYNPAGVNHPNFKTMICTRWEQGTCTFGTACRYAHGYHELRGPNMQGAGMMGRGPGPMCDGSCVQQIARLREIIEKQERDIERQKAQIDVLLQVSSAKLPSKRQRLY